MIRLNALELRLCLRLALVACLACLLCSAAASPARAQTITATVTGTITDPAGAVVPGASVTVTSNERGDTRTVQTDEEGRYTVPFLQPGTYTITVEGAGFGRATRSDIRLEVAQTAAFDFSLSANVQESVEVSDATAAILQTETSQLETTIEQKLLEDLPTGDRNIFNFVPFVPGTIDAGAALGNPGGAVGSAGNRNFFDSNFSVNGGRASSNDVLLDGVTNTIGDFNGVAISPPQDAVREFKVISGVAPAEFGRTAGGIVNIATRSGTNRFSGSLYEYFQDRELNANGFVRNRAGSRPNGSPVLPRINLNRSQFGGSLGGPVILPRFGEGGKRTINGKNRTFFFVNYEARREDNPFSRELLTVPTISERGGNLSDLLGGDRADVFFAPGNPGGAAGTAVRFGQVFDPFGALVPYRRADGTIFQGRPVIPNNDLSRLPVCPPGPRTQACLDPVALAVLGFIPTPNSVGQTIANTPGIINNFVISETNRFTRDIIAARIDQRISDKQSFFGRFSYEVRVDAQPNYFNSPASNARTIRDQFGNFVLNHVYAFSPTIVNNARYGYTRVRANQRPNGQGFDPTTLGLPSYFLQNAANLQFPDFTIGGGADAGTLPGQIPSGSIGGAGNNQPRDVHTVADNVTYIRGAHTFRTGGEYRLYRFFPFQYFTPVGSFTFDRTFTRGPDPSNSPTNVATAGSALASFLLGLPASGNREAVVPLTLYKNYFAAFLQDDYKLRRNLTLNLGVRFEYEPGTGEANELVSNFDFNAASPLNGRTRAVTDPFVLRANPDVTDLRGLLNFPEGPQTRSNPTRFAPRVGFAYSFDDRTTIRGGFGIFFLPTALENPTAQGTNFTTNLTQTSTQAQVTTGTVFLSNPFPNGLPAPVGNTLGANTQLGGNVFVVEPRRPNPYNQQYNLVLSREVARNLVVDLAYVGSRGVHLPIQQLNLNQYSPDVLAFARANFNQPNTCSTQTAAPFTLNAPCANVAAFFNQNVANPFQGLIPGVAAFNGASIARGQLLRQFPQYQNVFYFRPLVGDSSYNALQVSVQKRFSQGLSFNANYTFSKLLDTSGVGNGAAFLDANPVEDVYNLREEYSLSTLDVPHRFNVTATYELPFGRGRRFGGDLNRFADFFLGGYQVSGTATFQSGTPILIIANPDTGLSTLAGIGNAVRRPNRVAPNTIDRGTFRANARAGLPVIDRNAFATPADFTFGNAARTYDDLRRDGFRNVDLSIIKNFVFGERRTQRLQFRGEFLNAFNYVVFGTPERNINSPNFGLVTTQGNRPRIVQLVGRYTF